MTACITCSKGGSAGPLIYCLNSKGLDYSLPGNQGSRSIAFPDTPSDLCRPLRYSNPEITMENISSSASNSETVNVLRLWHQQYIETDGKSMWIHDPVVQAVQSDNLNHNQIEFEVQQLEVKAHVLCGFCRKCRWLLNHWPDASEAALGGNDAEAFTLGNAVHTREIEAASRAGCKFCTFIFSKLKMNSLLDTFRKVERRLSLLGVDETTTLSINIRRHDSEQRLWLNYPQKIATESYSTGAQACATTSERVSPTSCLWQEPLEPFTIAKVWLANCCKNHQNCAIKQYQPPTRLLCVVGNKVRLVITRTLAEVPQYSTLSYCWGKEPFIKLSRSNLAQFLNCIPWTELPQTFQDAIEATRKLGLKYVWIDALCIVQDVGDSDWAIEAGQMSSVYGGAFVSLAASDTRNVFQGFLRRPSANQYSGGFLARVTSKVLCEVRRFYDSHDYMRSVTYCHLSTRGWTLQEKLLPIRTIHFGGSGLWWDCRSQTSSEYLPDGDLSGMSGRHFTSPVGQPWKWDEIAWLYSGANLTCGSDRLAALSGIAARQQEATGDQYLAGLWKQSLTYDLLWRLQEHLEDFRGPGAHKIVRNRHRPKWRAPTWSWLSVDGRVAFGNHSQRELLVWSTRSPGLTSDEGTCKEYVRVLEAKTTPSGPDPLGQVSSGQLTLSCSCLIRGRLGHADGPEDLAGSIPFHSDLGVFPVVIDCWEETLFRDKEVVCLLPFLEGTYTIWGLVVQAESFWKGQYRRVGCFSFVTSGLAGHQENYFLDFKEVLEKLGPSTAAAECSHTNPVLEDDERRYVVTLV